MRLRIPQATKTGYIEIDVGGIFDYTYPNSKYRRGRVQGGGKICPAIMAGKSEILLYESINEITCGDTHKE